MNTVLSGIWEYMKKEKVKLLFTKRLNQDCAKNLFNIMGGHRDNSHVAQLT